MAERLPYYAPPEANGFLDAELDRVDGDGKKVLRQRSSDPLTHTRLSAIEAAVASVQAAVVAAEAARDADASALQARADTTGAKLEETRSGVIEAVDAVRAAAIDGSAVTRLRFGDTEVDGQSPLPVAAKFADENGVPYSEANPLPVDVGASLTINDLNVQFESVVSTGQTIDHLLAPGEVFIGPWEFVRDFASIAAVINTDVPSATNGAVAEFSHDGSSVIRSIPATIPANFGSPFEFAPAAAYFRIRYTNGPTMQGRIWSQVIYRFNPGGQSSQPIGAQTTDANMATVVKSHLAARHSSGAYLPVNTDGANLKVKDDALGATTNPAAGTVNARLEALRESAVNAEAARDEDASTAQNRLDLLATETTAQGTLQVLTGVAMALGGTTFLGDTVDRADRILGHVVVDSSALPTGATTEATLAAVKAVLDSLNGKDFSTDATLAQVLAAVQAVAANTDSLELTSENLSVTAETLNLNTDDLEALLTSLNGKDFATQATMVALLAATETLGTIDYASETTLLNLYNRIPTDPSTQTAQAAGNLKLDSLIAGQTGLSSVVAKDATTAQVRDGIGATTDDASTFTVIGRLKAIRDLLAGSLTVTGPLTDGQLRAAPVPVSGTVATGGLTDAQLRASRVPVDGSGVTQPVSGTVTANTGLTQPLTDAQLRAAAIPVSGTVATGGLTDTQLRASRVPVDGSGVTQPVSGTVAVSTLPEVEVKNDSGSPLSVTGPLTDTQLRATPVPVSGTVTANTGLTQPLTDTQLRAAAVPVTVSNPTSNPETGLAKDATLTTLAGKVPAETGTWAYASGAAGTVNVPSGARVLGIAAHSTAGGSFTIGGGTAIPVPANVGADVAPRANLVGPVAVVFTGTDSYLVEWLA